MIDREERRSGDWQYENIHSQLDTMNSTLTSHTNIINTNADENVETKRILIGHIADEENLAEAVLILSKDVTDLKTDLELYFQIKNTSKGMAGFGVWLGKIGIFGVALSALGAAGIWAMKKLGFM